MKNPATIIFVVIVLVGIGAAYYVNSSNDVAPPQASAPSTEIPEGATVITLTKDGFIPAEISVTKGTTITFVTENGKLFWPASNLHPSHALYPEFDPLLPIQADEAWSFTFENVGEWKYHDHLAPYYTGVITVTE